MAQRKRPAAWKILLVIMLIAGAIYASLFFLGIVDLPKFETKPTQVLIITHTATRQPTPKPSSTLTQTLQPSATLTATGTIEPTATVTATPTPTEKPMPFILKGTPQPVSSKILHPSWDCQYLVIGGQAWDLQDADVIGEIVHLGGSYGDELVDLYSKTGSVTLYGKSGYEFVLDNKEIENSGSLWIRLEEESGLPLSIITYLDVSSSCQENLIIVNFKQVR